VSREYVSLYKHNTFGKRSVIFDDIGQIVIYIVANIWAFEALLGVKAINAKPLTPALVNAIVI
jgi:hypothetical protein